MGGRETRHDINPNNEHEWAIDLLDEGCRSNPVQRVMTPEELAGRNVVGACPWADINAATVHTIYLLSSHHRGPFPQHIKKTRWTPW